MYCLGFTYTDPIGTGIQKLKSVFAKHCIPDILIWYNGLQFTSKGADRSENFRLIWTQKAA